MNLSALLRRVAPLAALALAACGSSAPLGPAADADLVALVQEVSDGRALVLHGTAGQQFPESYDCSAQSLLHLGAAAPAGLRPGQVIAVELGETELRSCPRQIAAERIRILR